MQVLKPEELQKRWLPSILGPQVAGRKLPGAKALILGTACGLACLMQVPDLLPGFPKAAVHGPGVKDLKTAHAILKVVYPVIKGKAL